MIAALLAWYGASGRAALPWRATRDPYRIVVSEFMLQQTQVGRVIPLYRAFIDAYPTIADLAAAPRADIVRRWRGLGYNSRAIRLHALAVAVVEHAGGVVPHETSALLALPGIGAYTAAAIRAFAFDLDDIAFDTNIRRVIHRTLFGFEFPPRASDAQLRERAIEAIPAGRGHDVNSALMDIGATICTARAPKCLLCPLRTDCIAAPIDPVRLDAAARAAARRSPQTALPFERTTRFIRGRIIDRLRDVPGDETLAADRLQHDVGLAVPADRLSEIPAVLATLVLEGIVSDTNGLFRLR